MLNSMINLFFPPQPPKTPLGLSQFADQQNANGTQHKKPSFEQWVHTPPISAINPLTASQRIESTVPINNPFMVSGPTSAGTAGSHVNPFSNKALPKDYGVNKPLDKPMFLGYHDDKPLMCGQKLFVSC